MIADAVLDVKVIPRAGRSQLAGQRAGAILIRLAAAPADGAANAELIAFLADLLKVPKRSISVIAGERSRSKRVKISGLDPETVRARLDDR